MGAPRPIGGEPRSSHPHMDVLDEDWTDKYEEDLHWAGEWDAVTQPSEGVSWPEGRKLFRGKLYVFEKLAVPDELTLAVVSAQHVAAGHVGVDRLVAEINRRFVFSPGTRTLEVATRVKRGCGICQASEPPNWPLKTQIDMTPIPSRIMTSVCIDIFSLDPVGWRGETFDCIVLCVDRHSGWMVAQPSRKDGLTA